MSSSETTHRYLMKDVKLLSPLTYSPHNYTIQLPTAAKGMYLQYNYIIYQSSSAAVVNACIYC